MHDSKRAAANSGRRPQKASACGQAYGSGIKRLGINCKKEGPADFLLHSAGHQYGDREVREVIRWKAGLLDVGSIQQALTSISGLEKWMANGILPALRLHFIHRLRRPGVDGR